MSTVFLDRDGVINENRPDYVKRCEEFDFIEGACEAIARLTQAGHRVVVCTNQAGVARELISIETLNKIHRHMMSGVEEAGGKIEKVYYCPHDKHENCACRKPRPGLLLRAREELGVDLSDAVFIGDSITDISAGIAAGVKPILVLSGLGVDQLLYHYQEANGPFSIATDLQDAVGLFLEGLQRTMATPPQLARIFNSVMEKDRSQDVRTPISMFLREHMPVMAIPQFAEV